jgi:hypothetical protein
MKNHPAYVRAAFREGSTWVAPARPLYCGPCGARLSKCNAKISFGRKWMCVACFDRLYWQPLGVF